MIWKDATIPAFSLCLLGCAYSPAKVSDPVDLALKTCGIGLSTQSAYVFKAAYEVAEKKGGTDFGLTMSESIDTQEMSLLKQLGDKSPESTKAIIEEVGRLRECVIAQSSVLRPSSRLELLEQCRTNIENRISPPDQGIRYGTLRYWNQAKDDPDYKHGVPIMTGYFDTGGSSSYYIKVQCNILDGKLQDAFVIDVME